MSSRLLLICVAGCLIAGAAARTVVNAAAENEVAGRNIEGAASVTVSDASPNSQKPASNPNLYNDIFNIPTSILGAVNRLLTGGGKAVSSAAGTGGTAGTDGVGGQFVVAGRIGGGADSDGADIGPGGTGAGGSASASATSGSGTGGTISGFFDNIFNIPITALQAVNQLLNNNHKAQASGQIQASAGK